MLSELGFSRILSQRNSRQIFDSLLDAKTQSSARFRAMVGRSLITSSGRTAERAILLHTSHNGMEQARYYRAMRRRSVRSVFMIHDLIPITHAEYCRPGVDVAHRERIHTALRLADGLILNSQDTLEALTEEAQRARLSLPPTVVARLAPGITSRNRGPRPLEPPYFVMLGTIEPRKNHWFMLHVWRRLVEELGPQAPKLVVIGRRGWECENVIDMLERCSAIQDAVIEKPDCSDDELRTWLQHARALLFPSFVEGYGMPLVEAYALGTPVLASDLSVFREIAGSIPDFLDPCDGPGWLARIQSYTPETSAERAAQLERITQFTVPTWQEHFLRVDAFLESQIP